MQLENRDIMWGDEAECGLGSLDFLSHFFLFSLVSICKLWVILKRKKQEEKNFYEIEEPNPRAYSPRRIAVSVFQGLTKVLKYLFFFS